MNRRSLFNGLVGLFVLFAFSAGKGKAYIYELYESGTKKWPVEIKKLGEIEIEPTGPIG